MATWNVASNGDLSARIDGLKVVIRQASGFTRFMLMTCQPSSEGAEVLLESGSEEDLRTAQSKAVTRALALAHRRA